MAVYAKKWLLYDIVGEEFYLTLDLIDGSSHLADGGINTGNCRYYVLQPKRCSIGPRAVGKDYCRTIDLCTSNIVIGGRVWVIRVGYSRLSATERGLQKQEVHPLSTRGR